jgi:hypothetical protein
MLARTGGRATKVWSRTHLTFLEDVEKLAPFDDFAVALEVNIRR